MAEVGADLDSAAPKQVRGVDNAAPILRISEQGRFEHD